MVQLFMDGYRLRRRLLQFDTWMAGSWLDGGWLACWLAGLLACWLAGRPTVRETVREAILNRIRSRYHFFWRPYDSPLVQASSSNNKDFLIPQA